MKRRLLTALVASLLAAGLAACDSRPCLEGHTESYLQMVPKANGGFHYVPSTRYVCDKYAPEAS